MAGPETALATGRTDLSELGPITAPAAAPVSATPSSADIAQGQQRASSAYGLDPNYRPQREQGPQTTLKQTGYLGNGQMARGQASGGDPLFAATMAVPTFEVDQQISNVRKQKQELADWISKQGEQFKGKAADPYQPAYEQYAGSEQGKMIQDVADTYFDGDVNKAWKGVKDDPELRARWDRNNRYLAAIGQANKGGYDYYEKVDKAIRDGNAEVDPETKQLLDSGLNAEWSFNGMGAAHNAAQFDRLNDRLTLNKMFDEFYREGVASAGDVTEGVGEMKWSVERDPKTGRKFLVIPKEKNYDEFVDSFVQRAMKDGPYRNEDEVRRFVEARVPRESSVKMNELSLGPSGGAAAQQRPRIGNFQVAIDNAVPKSAGHTGEVLMFPMVDKDNKPFTETMTFQGRAGGAKTLIPDHLSVDGNGNIFVVGPNPNSVETQTQNAGKAAVLKTEADDLTKLIQKEETLSPKEGETDAQQKARIDGMKKEREKKIVQASDLERQTTKTKESEAIRVDAGNEERIRLMFGDEQFNMVKQNAEKFKNRGRTGSLQEQGAAKPISYDKVKAKLPPGATQADFDEAMKTPEGRAYIESLK